MLQWRQQDVYASQILHDAASFLAGMVAWWRRNKGPHLFRFAAGADSHCVLTPIWFAKICCSIEYVFFLPPICLAFCAVGETNPPCFTGNSRHRKIENSHPMWQRKCEGLYIIIYIIYIYKGIAFIGDKHTPLRLVHASFPRLRSTQCMVRDWGAEKMMVS